LKREGNFFGCSRVGNFWGGKKQVIRRKVDGTQSTKGDVTVRRKPEKHPGEQEDRREDVRGQKMVELHVEREQ